LAFAALTLLACAKERSYVGISGEDGGAPESAEHGDEDGEGEVESKDAAAAAADDTCTVDPKQRSAPSNVDLLFMIDNSGSMAEEQKKLTAALPGIVRALTMGNRDGQPRPAGTKPEFPPVNSLHLGVVSSDMGINGAPSQNSCGDRSFVPTERDTRMSQERINKPVGDDGILQTSTGVAVSGLWTRPTSETPGLEIVAPDPACSDVTFSPSARFVEFKAGGDANEAAHRFGCIAKLGRNGCGLEQQLEAALKALTPPDSAIKFTALSPNGHGNAQRKGVASGFNQNFLRDDAILAIVLISDEEDCSIPDQSRAIFDATTMVVSGGLNVRCGLRDNQNLLHATARYVDGLKALKPAAYQDRVLFAAVVGIPLVENTGSVVHVGVRALDTLLTRADMQFAVRRNSSGTDDEAVPACINQDGDGSAAPGRRYLEVAKGFGDNGLVTSICEDQYETLMLNLAEKLAAQLSGTDAAGVTSPACEK
jgi:hypothetical protein